ncbi:MAG TPA: acyl-CoA dehydrogenase family protein [Xanthobacteraceae bacterium]|nr:acyl-CoA dehydrogenase family protein [Xanthobacteraceae bacterium]HWW49303.1 acyl-CoA dehydrogenase family protein [Xanthobacteraceae bacterium]
MTLTFSAEDKAFSRDVRDYLRDNLPASLAEKVRFNQRLTREDYVAWQDILAARNWYAIGWPKEAGGPGLTQTQRYLFEREYGALNCPHPCQFGIAMAGPVIFTFGNEAQKQRFLPGIRDNKDFWCQGYSEPGAGSDLAALKTSAVREGDHYRVNGQKIWTTWANWADWMFCLVKTDLTVKPQRGISFLLIDMKTPGITVRPIKTIDGDVEFNEVFFNDVMVPVENRIGEEGEGWTYAKFLLEFERFSMSGSARSKRVHGELKEQAKALGKADDALIADRLARLEIELLALEHMELRLLARSVGGENPGPEASKLKIRGTEIAQALTQLRIDLHAEACLVHSEAFLDAAETSPQPDAAGALATYLNQRKLTIWGGSNEVQRMILAKQILALG